MGILFLVSLPIGNPGDITERAVDCLLAADLIIGEEFKETSRLLKRIGKEQKFELLNEHSSEAELQDLFKKVQHSHSACLISDMGTPVLEDPGLGLVKMCLKHKVPVKAIPGANAVVTALVLSGLPSVPFSFLGFLPREKEQRRPAIKKALSLKHTLVFYETPYRYKKVIREFSEFLSKEKRVYLGLNLTTREEVQFHGSFGNLLSILDSLPKAPPVLIIDNS